MHMCEVVRIDQSCIWVYIRDCYSIIVLNTILDEIHFLLEDFLFSSRVLLQSVVCVFYSFSVFLLLFLLHLNLLLILLPILFLIILILWLQDLNMGYISIRFYQFNMIIHKVNLLPMLLLLNTLNGWLPWTLNFSLFRNRKLDPWFPCLLTRMWSLVNGFIN